MIDTIIFDLDGTLLNTLDDLSDSVNFALSKWGLPNRTIDEVRQFVGNGVEMLMKRAIAGRLTEGDELTCIQDFKEYYRMNMNNKTCPYNGILEVVQYLKQTGYHIAIVSNKFDVAVKELNLLYFDGIFPVAIGESANIKKKPSPDSVFEALKQLKAQSEHAVYVGDSDVDALTAKNANMDFVGVTWGFRDEKLLRDMGAKYIIHDPKQLVEILDRREKG